jgi:drug/metabolite transporter (DMT)-like permease
MLLTPQAAVTWRSPESSDVLLFAALGTSSAASHLLSIAAFRFTEASTLAPLVYLELVGAGLVGYFAFHEIPGRMTLLGGVFIVTAGLILLGQQSSERRRARSDAQAA